ncbi:MAG: hypothetical protein WBP85_02830 [Terracidiphilus sp.]
MMSRQKLAASSAALFTVIAILAGCGGASTSNQQQTLPLPSNPDARADAMLAQMMMPRVK